MKVDDQGNRRSASLRPLQQLGQLGDVGGDAPRFIAREPACSRSFSDQKNTCRIVTQVTPTLGPKVLFAQVT
jgi:hypothetical protein